MFWRQTLQKETGMLLLTLAIIGAIWLAYSNGANDNFKGVATLYGSGTTSFKGALTWASLTTFAGSAVSIFLARELVITFSGKGLVSDALAGTPAFAVAAGLGAALTIFVATRIGMPTSTTHALIGGLLGAGLVANAGIGGKILFVKFATPLLLSPVLAIGIAAILYTGFRHTRRMLGVTRETCVCLSDGSTEPLTLSDGGATVLASSGMAITVDETTNCVERYQGAIIGVDAQSSLDSLHFLSSGAVCFSRALNDTPKIAALLLTVSAFTPSIGIAPIAVAMTLGGILSARRVAETMSHRITDLNAGQGFTANLTTAALVLVASKLGVPVSTTHVSCGSIFGIGLTAKSCKWKTVATIAATWLTTLPVAAIASAIVYAVLA